jgi:putative membrane protein
MALVQYAFVVNCVSTVWSIEPLPAVGLLGAGLLYAAGIHRLRGKGRHWPLQRTLPFFLGLIAVAIATESPIAAQDTRLFSMHVGQHLLLSMAGPALLCLGAPITLFLQAARRPSQLRLLKVLHSKPVKLITFPIVTWMMFAGTLFVLYFTSLYDLSLRNAAFHELVHVHFSLAGFLFFAPVVAIDPHPWRMPHGLRLLYVGLTLPVHAFLALALLTATSPLGLDWYTTTTGRNIGQILRDQKVGAAVMWIAGDLLAISVVGIIAMQWAKEDERSAVREDRELDRQLRLENEGADNPRLDIEVTTPTPST